MKTATDDAFLADIIAHRDDDTPRLIYADWLEEQGRGLRAEFIRVQCKLARLWATTDAHPVRVAKNGWGIGLRDRKLRALYNQADALQRRERELLSGTVEALQFPPLRSSYVIRYPYNNPIIHAWGGEPLHHRIPLTFRRGFVADIAVYTSDWMEFADALCACAPLEEVTLSTWPGLRWDGPGQSSLTTQTEVLYPDEPYAAEVRRLLGEKWPNLKFHLPDASGPAPLRHIERPIVPRSRRS